jgi:glutamyl-tRNA synthetase
MRTRFAPSPTGYLHIGGARTALFSWLYARKQGGQFVLRIEDTDQERSTKAAVDAIIDGMNWLGLDYDQGPVFQTDRMPRYKKVVDQLLQEGKAYRCYCSKERLDKLRETQMADKEKPRYDGHCRNLQSTTDVPHVIRFKNPIAGSVIFDDLIRGQIEVQNSELDDLVLVRTDGMPTYNFAVVIDDWDMNITTVIRGDDHINNTPRQINIYHALGVEPPQFAHAPMILGSDGQRLSKRHGAVSVTQYRDEGYLPEAMLNYLLRLGWSHGNQEIFSKAEMINLFDVRDVNRAPASFNPEKLSWLNQHYLKTENPDYIAALLAKELQKQGVDFTFGPDLIAVVKALRERSKTLVELAEKAACFYCGVTHYDKEITRQYFDKKLLPVFEFLQAKLKVLGDWSEANIHTLVKDTMATFKLKMPELAQPLRVALTGNIHSPGIDLTLYLMGRERVMRAINRAMEYIIHTYT